MEISNEQAERYRRGFKLLNRFMILLWRLGLGSWGNGHRWLGSYMVILHVGRKSGRKYQTPVNYYQIDGEVYCTAGFGHKSDWYKNILEHPTVEIWLPDGRWRGLAADVTQSPNRRELIQRILFASGFAGPLFGADPRKMSPADLDRLLENYRLIRISRLEAVTGPGGPGDLAWLWPLMALTLVAILLMKSVRRLSSD